MWSSEKDYKFHGDVDRNAGQDRGDAKNESIPSEATGWVAQQVSVLGLPSDKAITLISKVIIEKNENKRRGLIEDALKNQRVKDLDDDKLKPISEDNKQKIIKYIESNLDVLKKEHDQDLRAKEVSGNEPPKFEK